MHMYMYVLSYSNVHVRLSFNVETFAADTGYIHVYVEVFIVTCIVRVSFRAGGGWGDLTPLASISPPPPPEKCGLYIKFLGCKLCRPPTPPQNLQLSTFVPPCARFLNEGLIVCVFHAHVLLTFSMLDAIMLTRLPKTWPLPTDIIAAR